MRMTASHADRRDPAAPSSAIVAAAPMPASSQRKSSVAWELAECGTR